MIEFTNNGTVLTQVYNFLIRLKILNSSTPQPLNSSTAHSSTAQQLNSITPEGEDTLFPGSGFDKETYCSTKLLNRAS
jgi:hypothetical protein